MRNVYSLNSSPKWGQRTLPDERLIREAKWMGGHRPPIRALKIYRRRDVQGEISSNQE